MIQETIVQNQPFITPNLDLRHGPAALIGRTMIKYEEEIRSHGLHLTVETMDTLLDINRREAEGWLPLVSIFDPVFH